MLRKYCDARRPSEKNRNLNVAERVNGLLGRGEEKLTYLHSIENSLNLHMVHGIKINVGIL
jgi:hypothetical protein